MLKINTMVFFFVYVTRSLNSSFKKLLQGDCIVCGKNGHKVTDFFSFDEIKCIREANYNSASNASSTSSVHEL